MSNYHFQLHITFDLYTQMNRDQKSIIYFLEDSTNIDLILRFYAYLISINSFLEDQYIGQ